MLDALAQFSDVLMEKVLDDQPVTAEEIKAAIRKGTVSGELCPVICGTSYKNKGVQALLDAVVDYLPSPLDVPPYLESILRRVKSKSVHRRRTLRSLPWRSRLPPTRTSAR